MKPRILFHCSINYLWWGVLFTRELVSLAKKEGPIVLCCSTDTLVDVYFVFQCQMDWILFYSHVFMIEHSKFFREQFAWEHENWLILLKEVREPVQRQSRFLLQTGRSNYKVSENFKTVWTQSLCGIFVHSSTEDFSRFLILVSPNLERKIPQLRLQK